MNILAQVTVSDQFFGLFKIDLRLYWAEQDGLNTNTYREYANMRKDLAMQQHQFVWTSCTGNYLPDYVWVASDIATFFKLKYELAYQK